MVNLLPRDSKTHILRRYYIRFISYFFIALAGVFLLGAGLSVPSYFLAKSEAETSLRYLDTLKQTADVRERAKASEQMMILAERTSILEAYAYAPAVAPLLEEISKLVPKGVVVTAIAIERDSATAGTIMLQGRAETRSALLTFAEQLDQSELLQAVEVPLDQLAIDTNLEFSLEFPFALQP